MSPERLAEIERILCSNATWWQDHAIELVAEVKRLRSIGDGKTLAECQFIARCSDPGWLGEELFRVQQVAFGAQAERDALRAEVERQKELRVSTRIMFDEAADERDRLRARVVELEERIRNIRLAPTGAPV